MSDYSKTTNFTAKDALETGNAAKVIKGAEFDTEFDAIQTAVNSKTDTTELNTHMSDTTTHGTTGDIVGTSDSQELTNKTLTTPTLTLKQAAAPTPTAEGDIQWDTDDNLIKVGDGTGTKTFVEAAATQTLTNKSIDLANNTVTGTTAEFNTAISDADMVTDTGSQTLTNKTLTSPVLTTPQINDTSADHQYVFAVSELAADRTVTLPLLTGNDTFVFKDFAQTFTNKTIDSANNTLTLDLGEGTLTGTLAEFNTALQSESFASLGGTETFTGQKTFNEDIVMQAANGIDFSANAGTSTGTTTSEILDWYEEGTFTPYICDASKSDSESQTHSVQYGRFTRIGRVCHFEVAIKVSSMGSLTTTNNAFIGGFPFVFENNANAGPVFPVVIENLTSYTAGEAIVARGVQNTDDIELIAYDSTAGTTSVLLSDIVSFPHIWVSGSYIVT